jgi:hypothetical protein
MSIELAITIFGFLATIGGFVFYFGQMEMTNSTRSYRMTK